MGLKNGDYCYVASIDTIFGREEAEEIAAALANLEGENKGIYCLAWEFEMALHQTVESIKAEHDITIQLIRIPREVMERNHKSPPFLAPAFLEAEPVYHTDGTVDVCITDFIPNFSEVPRKELEEIESRHADSPFDLSTFGRLILSGCVVIPLSIIGRTTALVQTALLKRPAPQITSILLRANTSPVSM